MRADSHCNADRHPGTPGIVHERDVCHRSNLDPVDPYDRADLGSIGIGRGRIHDKPIPEEARERRLSPRYDRDKNEQRKGKR